MFAAALLILSPVQSIPTLTVATVPGKGYAVEVAPFAPSLADAVTERIRAEAAKRCGSLTVRFGSFTYNHGAAADGSALVTDYRQRFSCIDPATDPYKPVSADWKPSAQDRREAQTVVRRYVAALHNGDISGRKMMEPLVEATDAQWLQTSVAARRFIKGAGSWELDSETWVNNPADAAHPGAYALFTIRGSYVGLAAYCGYVMLYRVAPGSYQVSQHSLQVIPQSLIDDGTITPAGVREVCGE